MIRIIKKYAWVLSAVLFGLGCNPKTAHAPTVQSVAITPRGATAPTTLAAAIRVEGEGTIRAKWWSAVYDTVRCVRTDTITIDSSGTYTSTVDSALGWFWLDIMDLKDSLLWHTDSVFVGPDSSRPKVRFTVNHDTGYRPLTVTFSNTTGKDAYTRWLWNFGDGGTSTDWSPVHVYQNPGGYTAVLTVYDLAGRTSDSAAIRVLEPLSVTSCEVTPPGSSAQTTLTAHIGASGAGEMVVKWWNAVYDSTSLVRTDSIRVDSTGLYTSVFHSGLGWYWVDIADENDSFLWHTDSVFCGPDTALPNAGFTANWYYGTHPFAVTFTLTTEHDAYARAFWDFRDGGTSTDWQPTHTFETAGQYYVLLKVRNLAGSARDSTLILIF